MPLPQPLSPAEFRERLTGLPDGVLLRIYATLPTVLTPPPAWVFNAVADEVAERACRALGV